MRDFFQDEHFTALHADVNEILKTKLHLVRSSSMPKSFEAYLEHAIQERDQRLLWSRQHINTGFVPGVEWPEAFYNDIKKGLSTTLAEYDAAACRIRNASPPRSGDRFARWRGCTAPLRFRRI